MAEFLFVSPQEMAQTSILGGNIDTDRIVFNIADTQISVIEPLLGTILYDKIVIEASGNTLTGLYLTLYTEYIQPITKYEAIAKYIEIAPYFMDNGGVFKRLADNKEIAPKEEVTTLAEKYHSIAQLYIKRFEKWICYSTNRIPEYFTYIVTDKVTPLNDIDLTAGWKL